MQAKIEDLEELLKVQEIDSQIIKLNRQLSELPHPRTVADARAKREQLREKQTQVAALKKDAAKRLTCATDEDASLAKKESGVMAAINSAGGNFRNVEARSNELAAISRRRGELGTQIEEIQAESEKIAGLEAQIAVALQELDRTESAATQEFMQLSDEIKHNVMQLEQRRNDILAKIDGEVANIYTRTAKQIPATPVGRLDGDRCGVCRASMDAGRLVDLRAQAPLAKCPSCKRLLIVE